jgi:hypothetical protein
MSDVVEQMGVLFTLEEFRDFWLGGADPKVRFRVLPVAEINVEISEAFDSERVITGFWIGEISGEWTDGLPDELSVPDLWDLHSSKSVLFHHHLAPQVWNRYKTLSIEDASLVLFTIRDYSVIPLEHFADVLFVAHTRKLDTFEVDSDTPEARDLAVEFLKRFSELMGNRTAEEVDKIVWGFLGQPFQIAWELHNDWDKDEIIGDVIRAMIHPFRDWLNHQPQDVFDTGFNMWWDLVLPYKTGETSLPCVLEVLSQILDLDHPSCVGAALHGVNHLGTREEREAVLIPYFDKMQFSQAERAEYEDILSGSCM